MIGQYLSNTNESATIPIPKILKFCELNKALLVPKKPKIFQDSMSHQIFGHMHEALNIDKNEN